MVDVANCGGIHTDTATADERFDQNAHSVSQEGPHQMYRIHMSQSNSDSAAPGGASEMMSKHVRLARTCMLAVPAALALGLLAGLQGPRTAEHASWRLATVAHADSCQTECCYPAFVTIHTNAHKGSPAGPPLQWRWHDLENEFVPVHFSLHYRSCNGGNSTVTMSGELEPSGQVQFAPHPGYQVNNACRDKTEGQSAFIRVVRVENWSESHSACGAVWSSGEHCFTDTDWDIAIAQRIYGPIGFQGQSYFDLIGITVELAPLASNPTLLTRSMQGLCSTTDVAPTMIDPGTTGFYGRNCQGAQICIQSTFN